MTTESAGEVVRRHRKQSGLTQKELAIGLDRNVSIIGQYEHDVVRPPLEIVAAIDRLLRSDGEILAAYGYLGVTPAGETELSGPLRQLVELTGLLGTRVQQLEERVRQLEQGRP